MGLSSTSLQSVRSVLLLALLLTSAEASVTVREVGKLKQFNGSADTLPGLTHITLAGVVQDGMKEVEAWLETLAPGSGTPIHRHDCEEVFIVVNGGGTVYIAPESDNSFPGEPVATSFSANSTFIVPVNAVHQVINTNDEDLHYYVMISRPPLKAYMYKDWNTHHDDVVPLIPILWERPSAASESTKDEL